MVNSTIKAVLFLFLAILVTSCGTKTLIIPVKRPAEINLNKFKKVVLSGFESNNRNVGSNVTNDYSDALTTSLIESQRFEVIDRQNLDKILREHNLNMSALTNDKEAAQMGEMLGSSALIFGRVSDYSYKEEVTKGDPYKDNKGNTHQYYYRNGLAHVRVNFKITDLTTGKILISKDIEASTTANTSADNQQPSNIDQEPMFSLARNIIIGDFMKKIAPYTERIKTSLYKDGDMPELEQGINMTLVDNWQETVSLFKTAVEKYKGTENAYKAYFNLGWAYEYTQAFPEAKENLNKAYSLKNDSDIANEIANCKRLEVEYKKLLEQEEKAK